MHSLPTSLAGVARDCAHGLAFNHEGFILQPNSCTAFKTIHVHTLVLGPDLVSVLTCLPMHENVLVLQV
jgi:hypothetical protein